MLNTPRGSTLLFVLAASLGFTLQGCQQTIQSLESKPSALGSTNEIVVVADDKVWEGPTGDTVEFYFGAAYPIMPTPEPLFDLRHFSKEDLDFDKLRKELRTYLIVANLNDQESPVTRMVRDDLGEENLLKARQDTNYFSTVGRDKWARGQLLIYVFGYGLDNLQSNIIKAFPAASAKVREHDQEQLHAATYLDGVSRELSNLVLEKFSASVEIPGDFQKAMEDDNFLWIRKDERDRIMNISMRTFEYNSESQLEKNGLIKMRDRLGLRIEGSSIGSYMRTDDKNLPVFTYPAEFGDNYAVESRGVWELTDDYLAGPFLNYAIVDGNRILMVDCFVYAPGKSKRDYIQQLEYAISSLRLIN